MKLKQKLFIFLGLVLLSPFVLVTSVHAQSFTFGAAGDYANGSDFKAMIAQVKAQNPDFHLALGDLAYSTVEQSWCSAWKTAGYNNILLVSGNHDSGESSAGNINTYAQFCPYTLSNPMTGTYAKQYYFDYPASNPIARIIMITPGLGGSFVGMDTNYAIGHPGYIFTQNAIDDARSKGIKWIVVGMHKNYISAMEKGNELGPDLMPMLFAKKVDLILQGHEHGYERSKQLQCAKTGSYDANCVVNSSSVLTKGAGSVIMVLGTGGQGLRGLNTGDPEYPYFAKTDNTTLGFGKFTVSPTSLGYSFVRSAGGTLSDSFTITDSGVAQPIPADTPIATPTTTPTPTPTRVPTATPTVKPTSTPTNTLAPTLVATAIPTSSCPTVSTINGAVTTTVTIPTSGTYTLWSRMLAPNQASNSYWLQIDNQCAIRIGAKSIAANVWTWVDYRDGNETAKVMTPLTVGNHIVKLIGAESGVKVAKLFFTTDSSCLPNAQGNGCTNTVTPTLMPSEPTAITTLVPTASPLPTQKITPTLVPTITVIPGTIVSTALLPIADTFVEKNSKDKKYGDKKELEVDGSPVKIIYMKFNLTPYQGKTLESAILRFYVTDVSSSIQYIKDVSSTSWDEHKMTYNNRPRAGTVKALISKTPKEGVREINLTPYISEKLGSVVSFAIDSEGSNGLDFYSKENSTHKPVLLLKYR